MNRDRVEGNWKQLEGRLQDSHGIAKDVAAKRIRASRLAANAIAGSSDWNRIRRQG